MMAKQSENGLRDEKLACELFKKWGYWAHSLAKGANGSQPFDIIAVRGKRGPLCDAWFVDVKNVRKEEASFPFSRIEPNQLASMRYLIDFAKVGHGHIGFVIYSERDLDNPVFLPYLNVAESLGKGKKSAKLGCLVPMSIVLQEMKFHE